MVGAILITSALVVPAGPATAAGNTLTVNVGTTVRPVTHVASGGLYGVSASTNQTLLNSLRPKQFTQPPPGTQQLGNGATSPCCDALSMNSKMVSAGAKQYIRMPDIFRNFPYNWVSWADWNAKVDTMVQAKINAGSGASSVNGWELWNEPDWTWPSSAGSFLDGWTTTYNRIRSRDGSTPIVGPSYSRYEHTWMLNFMTHARNTNTLPAVTVWHELDNDSYLNIQAHVADYRAIESSLGISPRPISINEYASPSQVDQPSVAVHYMAVFERHGILDAERAYWYEAGTFDGLLYNNQPTASYWAYKWYADQTGNIVQTIPGSWLEGVASYDSGARRVNVVFGGDSGNNTVRVNGLGAFGATANVQVLRTNNTGRTTNQAAPIAVSSGTYTISGGSITVPVNNMDAVAAYQLLVTPGGSTPPPPSGYVRLRNVATGLYLDNLGSSTNGADVVQYGSSTSYNQQWQIQASGSYVRLQNRASGLYLDGMGRTSNGSNVGQWAGNSSYNQQWTQVASGSNVRFQNRTTGLFLDGMGRTGNGAICGQWASSSSSNQQWVIVPV